MISDYTVQRVKDLSIVDVLGKYVKLQRQGANYVCCCPFHGEKSPSLNVSPSKNLWHCFGCDRGGDAIKFVMELQNIEFHTAVEEIAKNNGVYVEYVATERSEEQSLMQSIVRVCSSLLNRCRNTLFLRSQRTQ